jgi:hypothetical protein
MSSIEEELRNKVADLEAAVQGYKFTTDALRGELEEKNNIILDDAAAIKNYDQLVTQLRDEIVQLKQEKEKAEK